MYAKIDPTSFSYLPNWPKCASLPGRIYLISSHQTCHAGNKPDKTRDVCGEPQEGNDTGAGLVDRALVFIRRSDCVCPAVCGHLVFPECLSSEHRVSINIYSCRYLRLAVSFVCVNICIVSWLFFLCVKTQLPSTIPPSFQNVTDFRNAAHKSVPCFQMNLNQMKASQALEGICRC